MPAITPHPPRSIILGPAGDAAVVDGDTLVWDGTSGGLVRSGSGGGGSGITQLTGDVTAGPGSGSQAATLANTAVTPGTYGTATKVSTITIDSKGRITAASETTITVADTVISFTDNTTGNASTSAHGYLKKLDNSAAHFMDGQGNWSTPAGAGNVTTSATLTANKAVIGNGTQDVTISAATGVALLNSGTLTGGDLSGAITTSGASLVTSVGTIPGRLIGIQIITATGAGTYTPTSGTTSIVIELQGGGGGGGGCATSSGTNAALATGGSAGAYLRKRLTTAFSGAGYVVGAKGTGGSAGTNNGNPGADTTFTATGGGGTVYTAAGGGAGAAGAAGSVPAVVGGIITGGAATNGDVNISGGYSIPVICLSASNICAGGGGTAHLGQGAVPVRWNSANTSNAGNAGTGKGSGGGGAGAGGTGTQKAGGDGTDGVIIIWEFS